MRPISRDSPDMKVADIRIQPEAGKVGRDMHQLVRDLYPICRSITGDGLRETLRQIGQHIPLSVHEVASGTAVFDWTVPKEWNIRDAYIKDSSGQRVIDFKRSNLHVVNYSVPVHRTMSLEELKPYLHTLPEHTDWIPYRTSYYRETWGFCLTHREFSKLLPGEYEVCIDSSLEDGHLTYGECYLPGESGEEVLFSSHVCHPSLCNDNLSGISLAVALAQYLQSRPHRYSYRFLFAPTTIGTITWLAKNEAQAGRVKHGLVLACIGDAGNLTYKKSRRGNAEVDHAVSHVLKHGGGKYEMSDFSPWGYDERQFCSPGFNLPMGCLMRTPNGRFPEYHTSADNLDFVRPEHLEDSYRKCLSILDVLENNRVYVNQNPKCEPRLGKRGLYGGLGSKSQLEGFELALLWVLNFSDGDHDLLQIAEKADMEFSTIREAADALRQHQLLEL